MAIRTRANSMVLAVKAAGQPSALASALRAVVARIDPELPVTNLETTRATVEESLGPESFQTGLVGAFAALAMLLAAVGIYGVVSYAVAKRTQEIGVRMALSDSRESLVRMVVRQGMKFVLLGVGLGLFASLGLTRVITGFLYGVNATDRSSDVRARAGRVVYSRLGCEFRSGAARCQHRSCLRTARGITAVRSATSRAEVCGPFRKT